MTTATATRIASLRGPAPRTASDGQLRVDAANSAIYSASLMTIGEATGWPFSIDSTTIDLFIELANQDEDGVIAHFRHPSVKREVGPDGELNEVIEDHLGAAVGVVKNVRRDNDRARGDIFLGDYAADLPGEGNVKDYLLKLAEGNPRALGMSAMFQYSLAEPASGNMGLPPARPTALESIDFVERPAANPTGLLSRRAAMFDPQPPSGEAGGGDLPRAPIPAYNSELENELLRIVGGVAASGGWSVRAGLNGLKNRGLIETKDNGRTWQVGAAHLPPPAPPAPQGPSAALADALLKIAATAAQSANPMPLVRGGFQRLVKAGLLTTNASGTMYRAAPTPDAQTGIGAMAARAGDPNLMSDRQRESLHTASHMFLLKLLTGDTSSATLPPPSPGVATEATLQSDGDTEPSAAVNGVLAAAPHAARILTARAAALDNGIDEANLDQAVRLLGDKWDKVLTAAESLRMTGKLSIIDDDEDTGDGTPADVPQNIVAQPAGATATPPDDAQDDPDDDNSDDDDSSDASVARSVKTAAAASREWQEMVSD